MSNELYQIQYSVPDILVKRAKISNRLLARSETIRDVTLTKISIADLQLLFQLYDEIFFENRFTEVFRGQLKFSLSRRLTKSAGKTICSRTIKRLKPEEVVIEIRMGLDFFFRYYEIQGDKAVSGIITQNPLEAFQIVFEHELCHMIEFIYFHHSSCRGKRFRTIAGNIFGHTASYHQLPTGSAIAQERLGLKLGDIVSFEFEGRMVTGLLYKITKRAVIMVRDSRGRFTDSHGQRYSKYYVPLNFIKKSNTE